MRYLMLTYFYQANGKIDEGIYRKVTDNLFVNLFFENPIIHSTVLIRRSILIENLYNIDYGVAEDFEDALVEFVEATPLLECVFE